MIVPSDKRRNALRLPTLTEITTEWPATVDIAEAGAAFGLSRSYAYELVARVSSQPRSSGSAAATE
jgi:hypothetical protein